MKVVLSKKKKLNLVCPGFLTPDSSILNQLLFCCKCSKLFYLCNNILVISEGDQHHKPEDVGDVGKEPTPEQPTPNLYLYIGVAVGGFGLFIVVCFLCCCFRRHSSAESDEGTQHFLYPLCEELPCQVFWSSYERMSLVCFSGKWYLSRLI